MNEHFDNLWITFQTSGVETWLWLPPTVAFAISFFTSMVGISGAFLLLPFQMSVLNFTDPAVSPTNLVYNLVAIPGGVYRYAREGRMLWPLVAWIVAGTIPGMAIGYGIRITYLPEAQVFGVFVGVVLIYTGYRLFSSMIRTRLLKRGPSNAGNQISPGRLPIENRLRVRQSSLSTVAFRLGNESYSFRTSGMFFLAFFIGIIGGIYGIGGGAFIAPFCVSIMRLPVYAVAGAALASTLIGSLSGVLFYQFLPGPTDLAVRPDWSLGLLFGLGGLVGSYLGARFQRRVPQSTLELVLSTILMLLGIKYLVFGI